MPLVPGSYICPLSNNLMIDPAITSGGETYAREVGEDWFYRGNKTDPSTNESLANTNLTTVFALRDLIARFIKKHGSKLCSQSEFDNAINAGNGDAKALDKLCYTEDNVEAQDSSANRALHLAVVRGNVALAEYLITQGQAKLEEKNTAGDTPLGLAVRLGKVDMLQFLLSQGAERNNLQPELQAQLKDIETKLATVTHTAPSSNSSVSSSVSLSVDKVVYAASSSSSVSSVSQSSSCVTTTYYSPKLFSSPQSQDVTMQGGFPQMPLRVVQQPTGVESKAPKVVEPSVAEHESKSQKAVMATVEKCYDTARTLYQSSNYAEAFAVLCDIHQEIIKANIQHTPTLLLLAECHLMGRGTAVDHNKSVAFLTQAANQGSTEAASRLGSLYLEGKQVGQNISKVYDFLRRAAANNDVRACFNLGLLLKSSNDKEVKQDWQAAISYFKRCAENANDQELRNQACAHINDLTYSKDTRTKVTALGCIDNYYFVIRHSTNNKILAHAHYFVAANNQCTRLLSNTVTLQEFKLCIQHAKTAGLTGEVFYDNAEQYCRYNGNTESYNASSASNIMSTSPRV
jgi:TPR repeat protein